MPFVNYVYAFLNNIWDFKKLKDLIDLSRKGNYKFFIFFMRDPETEQVQNFPFSNMIGHKCGALNIMCKRWNTNSFR